MALYSTITKNNEIVKVAMLHTNVKLANNWFVFTKEIYFGNVTLFSHLNSCKTFLEDFSRRYFFNDYILIVELSVIFWSY